MDKPFILFILLFILLFISAFFSSSETGMLAVNRYRLRNLANNGNKGAKLVEKLLADKDSLISAILLGNNLVNIFAASIVTILAIKLFDNDAIFLASIILTIVVLIFAETTPKNFAYRYPEEIALFSAPILNIFIKIFKPIVIIINKISLLIFKLFKIKITTNNHKLSMQELKMSMSDAKANIANNYYEILLNIIDLQEINVDDIMIPKNSLITINIDNDDNILQNLQHTQHTRLLVYKGSKNNIIGVLHVRDVLNLYAKGEFSMDKLKKIVKDVYILPEGVSLSQQLEQFQYNKKRLGVIVDEYGEVKGAITLDDILEELVGSFTSNSKEKIQEFSLQNDGSYLFNPSINIHKINNILGIKFNTSAKTLNGLILEKLQRIPKHNVSIKVDNVLIEIVRISNNNIKLVKIIK